MTELYSVYWLEWQTVALMAVRMGCRPVELWGLKMADAMDGRRVDSTVDLTVEKDTMLAVK